MSKITAVVKKPYCKVCHDAGKPESEYNNHWVKDLTGKTTCPTLLNTECRWCYKLGHTAKFCKELEKSKREKDRVNKKTMEAPRKPEVSVKNKHANSFSALCEDSEEEEDNVYNIEYPAVASINVPNATTEVKSGWAAIVSKPKEVKPVEIPKKTGLVLVSNIDKPEVKLQEKKPETLPKKSWADWSDSEDEDDPDMYDEDLKWRTTYVPGLTDEVWARLEGVTDSW